MDSDSDVSNSSSPSADDFSDDESRSDRMYKPQALEKKRFSCCASGQEYQKMPMQGSSNAGETAACWCRVIFGLLMILPLFYAKVANHYLAKNLTQPEVPTLTVPEMLERVKFTGPRMLAEGTTEDGRKTITIRLPNVTLEEEGLHCFAQKVPMDFEADSYGLEVTFGPIHHINMEVCSGEFPEEMFGAFSRCRDGPGGNCSWFTGWNLGFAKNDIREAKVPPNSGGGRKIKKGQFLTLELHNNGPMHNDASAFIFRQAAQPVTRSVHYRSCMSHGQPDVPPHSVNQERYAICEIVLPEEVFFVHLHAHSYARLMKLEYIANGTTTLVTSGPSNMMYGHSGELALHAKPGGILKMTCIYDNPTNHSVIVQGATSEDEMCQLFSQSMSYGWHPENEQRGAWKYV